MNNLMTDWQTVIFRNYGMVQDEVLSGILQMYKLYAKQRRSLVCFRQNVTGIG